MFRIGEFSKLCRVPVSALRYYADIGLLEPAQVDTFTSYRCRVGGMYHPRGRLCDVGSYLQPDRRVD